MQVFKHAHYFWRVKSKMLCDIVQILIQITCKTIVAVYCSLSIAQLGGVGLGSGTTGKLGRAWVHGCVIREWRATGYTVKIKSNKYRDY